MKNRRWQQFAAATVMTLAAASARSELSLETTAAPGIGLEASALSGGLPAVAPFAQTVLPVQPTRLNALAESRAFRLSASESDLSLWAFMTTMRRLQRKEAFGVLESNARLVELSAVNVAPVPLPGAAWLMVMGLSGLIGMRWTRRPPRGSAAGGPALAAN